jgi:hypothetical protein
MSKAVIDFQDKKSTVTVANRTIYKVQEKGLRDIDELVDFLEHETEIAIAKKQAQYDSYQKSVRDFIGSLRDIDTIPALRVRINEYLADSPEFKKV